MGAWTSGPAVTHPCRRPQNGTERRNNPCCAFPLLLKIGQAFAGRQGVIVHRFPRFPQIAHRNVTLSLSGRGDVQIPSALRHAGASRPCLFPALILASQRGRGTKRKDHILHAYDISQNICLLSRLLVLHNVVVGLQWLAMIKTRVFRPSLSLWMFPCPFSFLDP